MGAASPAPDPADIVNKFLADAAKDAKPKKPRPKQRGFKEQVKAPPPRPSLEAFLDHFFAIAGGPARVAQMMYSEFRDAPAGSQIRGRVLETILRTLKAADSKAKPLDDLGVMTDEDVDRELVERERLFALAMNRGVTDEQRPGPGNAHPPQGQNPPADDGSPAAATAPSPADPPA